MSPQALKANSFSTHLTGAMQKYRSEHGLDEDQQYLACSCNSADDADHVLLCGATNTLGR